MWYKNFYNHFKWGLEWQTFSTIHSVPAKMAPIIAKAFAVDKLRLPIWRAVKRNCSFADIWSTLGGVSRAASNIPMKRPSPPPENTMEHITINNLKEAFHVSTIWFDQEVFHSHVTQYFISLGIFLAKLQIKTSEI